MPVQTSSDICLTNTPWIHPHYLSSKNILYSIQYLLIKMMDLTFEIYFLWHFYMSMSALLFMGVFTWTTSLMTWNEPVSWFKVQEGIYLSSLIHPNFNLFDMKSLTLKHKVVSSRSTFSLNIWPKILNNPLWLIIMWHNGTISLVLMRKRRAAKSYAKLVCLNRKFIIFRSRFFFIIKKTRQTWYF